MIIGKKLLLLGMLADLFILCREESETLSTRCGILEKSRDELRLNLTKFTDFFNIDPDELHLTGQKLGSGGFAGKTVFNRYFILCITLRRFRGEMAQNKSRG